VPDLSLEKRFTGKIIGIDEAGRGPWAGPVTACALYLKPGELYPKTINDSKKISKAKRENLFKQLQSIAIIGVGQATVEEIDQYNILAATKLAMQRAVNALPFQPDMALVDGNHLPDLPCQAEAIIKGDSKSLSIASASIIAKVTRDRIMDGLHQSHPHYAWDRNAGYGTKAHQEGLKQFGVTAHHRRSFRPVRELIEA